MTPIERYQYLIRERNKKVEKGIKIKYIIVNHFCFIFHVLRSILYYKEVWNIKKRFL